MAKHRLASGLDQNVIACTRGAANVADNCFRKVGKREFLLEARIRFFQSLLACGGLVDRKNLPDIERRASRARVVKAEGRAQITYSLEACGDCLPLIAHRSHVVKSKH